ncbi:MAG: ribose-5-phosphate isomerase RpiA [Treponema sp.]
MSNMLSQDEQKKAVARHAIDTLVQEKRIYSGMKIGLGTGSTALPAVKRLAEYIAEGTLQDIAAVPTSFQTAIACEEYGIPVYSLSAKRINGSLDLTIDGADEIDPAKNLIKGGGAALLREKIIAYNSTHFVVIGDHSKSVQKLGCSFPLPVEIVPEARASVMNRLMQYGVTITLREGIRKKGPIITDNGNFILDILWNTQADIQPRILEQELNTIPGVIENGFFTVKTPRVFLTEPDGSIRDF